MLFPGLLNLTVLDRFFTEERKECRKPQYATTNSFRDINISNNTLYLENVLDLRAANTHKCNMTSFYSQ